MDHAEAHERIADAALEPRRLVDLEIDPTPEDRALLAHVATCATCRADLDGWRQTHAAVFAASAGSILGDRSAGGSDAAPAAPPDALRAAVSAIPGRSPRLLDSGASRVTAPTAASVGGPRWRLTAVAAVVVVALVIGLGGLAAEQARQADVARRQVGELAELSGSIDRVLHGDHSAIALVGLDGAPAGTVAWSPAEIVVMTTALTPPGAGAEYRCWVERDGQRTPIGVMHFADGLAYWAGSLDRYDDLPLDGGGRLGVSLEQTGHDGGGAPVLIGELPS
jgi:hypothetical protein